MSHNHYSPYNLFLDDIRFPDQAYLFDEKISLFGKAYSKDWVIVRSYDEFVKTVEEKGLPCMVSFDHDLHSEHMKEFFDMVDKHETVIDYSKLRVKTGMHCAKYLVEKMFKIGLDRCNVKVFIHSANPFGRASIRETLQPIFDYAKLSAS